MNIEIINVASYAKVPKQAAEIHQYLLEKFPEIVDKKIVNTHLRNITNSDIVMPGSKCILINTWNYYYRSMVNADLIAEYEGNQPLPKRSVKIDTFNRKAVKSTKIKDLQARIDELEDRLAALEE